jgi:iron complex outermembrane receptor protein
MPGTSSVATRPNLPQPPTRCCPPPGGLNIIEEDRRDLYAEVDGKSGSLSFLAGLRYESTDFTVNDLTVPAVQSNDYSFLLPSASLKFDLENGGRITMSVARTNRRPRLDFLSPALLEAELGDNDLLGNPALKPETAWGGDLGYEHKIGRTGVVGVNLFYRKVNDLIELANTGVTGSEGAGTFVLQPQNTGDGKVYGIEFDLSDQPRFLGAGKYRRVWQCLVARQQDHRFRRKAPVQRPVEICL